MVLKVIYLFIRLFLILKYIVVKVYSYDIAIKSDDDMSKLYTPYNELNKAMKYREYRILFDDDEEYFLECLGQNHFNVYYTLMFLSEKGSILNFGTDYIGSMKFHLLPGTDMKKVYFKNLTFKDFDGHNMKHQLFHFSLSSDKNDVYIEFENCTFINITGYSLQMEVTYKNIIYDTPQFVFKNCTFMYG